MLRYEAEIHSRLLIDLITTRSFQIQQTREQVRTRIHRHYSAHYAAHFDIEERRNQLLDQPCSRNVVRIENQDDLGRYVFHCVFQRRSLAAFASCAMKRLYPSGKLLHELVDDFAGTVG